MKRRVFVGSIAAAGAMLAAGLYRFTDLFVKHYPPTPYDDLLQRLGDRDQAGKLGAKASGAFDARNEASRLRAALQNKSLAAAADADIAAGRVTEIDGWLLPETVALLSVLAANA